MYELFGFAENLKIQNCVSSKRNCVHMVYKLSEFAKKFEFYKYVEYTKLRKFN